MNEPADFPEAMKWKGFPAPPWDEAIFPEAFLGLAIEAHLQGVGTDFQRKLLSLAFSLLKAATLHPEWAQGWTDNLDASDPGKDWFNAEKLVLLAPVPPSREWEHAE